MFANLSRIQRNRELNGERGFTLIELLIVIVVLGILAAIVVFALGGVTGQSAVAACTSGAKTVSIAISAEQAETPGTAPTAGASSNLIPTYLKSWPSNPTYYQIGLIGTNVSVELATGDPGASATNTPAGPGTATFEAFEGASPYFFPSTTGNTWGALAGQGICAGA